MAASETSAGGTTPATGSGDIGRDLAQLRERPRHLAVQTFARLGQPQAARSAFQQPRAELLFQAGNRGAQARFRPVERARRRREAAVLHDVAERVEVIPVHRPHPRTLWPARRIDAAHRPF